MPCKPSTRGTKATPSPYVKPMADGRKYPSGLTRQSKCLPSTVNEARAMRVAEVMNDYHTTQRRISQCQVAVPQDDYHELGYQVLRQCQAEAQTVLAYPYQAELLQPPRRAGEGEKRQLQRILLDASVRRFQAQKIYLRAAAAIRWVNARNAILRGQKPTNGNVAAVQQIDRNLRTEVVAITDQGIVNEFRRLDTLAGHYLTEDPPLSAILTWIRAH